MNDRPPRRCAWVAAAPEHYVAYHDREWGFPVADARVAASIAPLRSGIANIAFR